MIHPASGYATKQDIINRAANTIEEELEDRLQVLEEEGKLLEKQRLEQRTRYDVEALREFGVCPGIENTPVILMEENQGSAPIHCLIISLMIFY